MKRRLRDARLTRVGLFVNLEKPEARAALAGFSAWLHTKSVETLILDEQARELSREESAIRSEGVSSQRFFGDPELIVSLGGDGTFLHVARHIPGPHPALLGVNFGRLGYLTAVESTELRPFFERMLEHGLHVQERLRIGCRVPGWDAPPVALNDVVIQDAKGIRSRRLRITVGRSTVGVFVADGIIVATPTGSTAYNLSVGGPIVHPRVRALIIAFISPHTLSARAMVIGADDVVTVEALEDRPIRVTIDGQETRTLARTTPIELYRGPDVAMVLDPERTFINRLREKLSWGGNSTD